MTKPAAAALAKRCDAWHLRLDKFSFERDGAAEAKTEALNTARECYRRNTPIHLKPASERCIAWLAVLQRQHGARFGTLDLVSESRLLLHLGRANVLENVGLYAEHTTGLPIVPGTALKGVVSTWACWAEHFDSANDSFRAFTKDSAQRRSFSAPEAKLARIILGDDHSSGSDHAGEVVFLGGFPMSPPYLGLDIVNPHHETNGAARQSLTPNAFLSVEPLTRWRFAFFVRPGVPDAAVLLAQTRAWIEEALTQIGIGAKTAAGYGRFRLPSAADRAAESVQEARDAADQAVAAKRTEAESQNAKLHAAAQAALNSDYSNPATFKNRVLDKLSPAVIEQLCDEVRLLQKPENESFRDELRKILATRSYKDIRKRLRDKDWFPNEWLPPQ